LYVVEVVLVMDFLEHRVSCGNERFQMVLARIGASYCVRTESYWSFCDRLSDAEKMVKGHKSRGG
jgi:hypothetical protein